MHYITITSPYIVNLHMLLQPNIVNNRMTKTKLCSIIKITYEKKKTWIWT